MKIGILTYHWVANFGANLQTLSTINYITQHGDEPIVINWIPEDLEKIYSEVTPSYQFDVHREFAETYYRTTEICRNSDDIAKEIKKNKIDFIIIGSDAVLTYSPFLSRFYLGRKGPGYNKPAKDSDFPNPFWGEFISSIPDVPVALMSVSAQNTKYNLIKSHSRKHAFSKALKQFTFVSVRDVWTKNMIGYLTKDSVDVTITPDPVFGFNYNHADYLSREHIMQKFRLPDKYILFSFSQWNTNRDWLSKTESLFEKGGYASYELPKPHGLSNLSLKNKIELPVSPLEWYYLIKYSGGYIGELMHPILVSIHNSVPFFSFDTYGYMKGGKPDNDSSKIYHIVSKCSLLDNYYSMFQKNYPKPENVYKSVINFDYKTCQDKSKSLYEEYRSMMETLYQQCEMLIKTS